MWKLFPRDQVINLSFWDYNDVAPGYFAAAEIAAREQKVGVIVIEVARPDFRVADRSTFADLHPGGCQSLPSGRGVVDVQCRAMARCLATDPSSSAFACRTPEAS